MRLACASSSGRSGASLRACAVSSAKTVGATSVGAHLRFKSAEFMRSDSQDACARTTNMKRAICSGVLMIVLFLCYSRVPSAKPTAAHRPGHLVRISVEQFNQATSTMEPGWKDGVEFSFKPCEGTALWYSVSVTRDVASSWLPTPSLSGPTEQHGVTAEMMADLTVTISFPSGGTEALRNTTAHREV